MPAVRIGRLSYSWYLVHWPVILVLTPERSGLDTWALLGAKVVVSLLVAMALHHAIEQPLRRLEPPRGVVVATWIGASLIVAATAAVVL
jgi:peptidoglycan/LPS O-acetylase OafA/YrhL